MLRLAALRKMNSPRFAGLKQHFSRSLCSFRSISVKRLRKEKDEKFVVEGGVNYASLETFGL
ncbi:MAG TPA: hypothetical protein VGC95_03655 [Chitinophagaceae bacterium]